MGHMFSRFPGRLPEIVPEIATKIKREDRRGFIDYEEVETVIIVSQAVLSGMQCPFLKEAGMKKKTFEEYQDILNRCWEEWQILEYRKVLYKEAQKTLHSYYSQDKICDFMNMLEDFWKKEPRADMDPAIYGEKGYFNYIFHIRSMFGQLKEAYRELPLERERRIPAKWTSWTNMLRELAGDNDRLMVMLDTLEDAKRLFDKMVEGEALSESEKCRLNEDKDLLQEILNSFKKDQLKSLGDYLDRKRLQADSRNRRIMEDVLKSRQLYRRLYAVLGQEESFRRLEELNPDHGGLEGKSIKEIRDMYEPLMRQVKEILTEFPKDSITEA